jgi:hypothetical protein
MIGSTQIRWAGLAVLPSIFTFLLMFSASVPDAAANNNVYVSRFWHNHQPIYWPDWNRNGDQWNRGQYAWDSISLKSSQNYGGISPSLHPENDLGTIFGLDDRKNAYQFGPKGSLETFSGGGFAMSYSGSLIDNVRQLGGGGHLGYQGNWNDGIREARRDWGRLDMLGFTYHHSLGPLLPKEVFRKEVRIFKQAWWKAWGGNSDLSDHSKGFFPTEMAYSRHLIDVLVDEGFEWTLVPSHHVSRTSPSYFDQFDLENGSYGIYSSPPNKADLLGPSFSEGWWYGEPNPGNAAWNVAPYAYQLHRVKYVDPETGDEKRMYAVPSDDVLSYRYGYANEGVGKIDQFIAPFADVPVIVIPSTDGDNAWGGGSSSWFEATPQLFNDSAARGYRKSMPQTFVDDVKGTVTTDSHIEDGAWIFPESCYGSPNFLKWIEPPVVSVANRYATAYPGTQVDMETPGFALKFYSYAPLMAGANWIITAQQILEDEGGSVQDYKVATPYDWDGSYTFPNDVELAWHIYLKGLDSGFNYYGGLGNDDEVKPALATKNAIEKLQESFMTPQRMAQDTTPPTVLKPQRFPYNPGAYTFGWFNYQPGGDQAYLKKNPSYFYIWTHAYDLNGIPDGEVKAMVRIDNDGVNPLNDNQNETYAGGPDVGEWIEVTMTKRVLPKTRAALNAAADNGEIDYFVFDPAFWAEPIIADYYFAKIDDATVPDFRGKLLDYYIVATDSLGNVHKSEIQHVFVEDDGEGGSSVSFSPSRPSDCEDLTVTYTAVGGPLEGVNPVFLQISFDGSSYDLVEMSSSSADVWTATVTNVPDNAPSVTVWFQNTDNSVSDNNGGANWSVGVRDCDAPVNGVLFDPAAPSSCTDVTVRYYPEGRPLAGASQVYIQIGRNGWQDTLSPDPAMTNRGTYWEYTYVMETNTTEINVVFNNGAGVWDSNNSLDWNLPVTGCGDEPEPLPPVSISPTNPVGCGPITITYNPSSGDLLGASQVYIHIGRHGWQDVIEPNPAMTASGANWTYTYTPPAGTTNIIMAFNNGAGVWDSNGGTDWQFAVEGCESLPSGLAVTNVTSGLIVPFATDAIDLAGIADGFQGDLVWTNSAAGVGGTVSAASTWTLSDVPLAAGGNEIVITGTRATAAGVRTNAIDSAGDFAYNDGWNAGNNGGSGFGGWTFNHAADGSTYYAGVFVEDPAPSEITGLGSPAFGFYANPIGSFANAEVQRAFSVPMTTGSVFELLLGLNWDSNTNVSNRGLSLLAGTNELFNINMAGSPALTISGQPLFDNYGTQAMPLRFTYVADGLMRVQATGRDGVETYDETLTVPAGAPSAIKFYFNATTSEAQRQMYINDLKITSPTQAGVETSTVSVIVTRQSGDSNNDGVPDSWYNQFTNALPPGMDVTDPDIGDYMMEDGNGHTLKESYRLNLDPTDPEASFALDALNFVDGQLQIQWGAGGERWYQIEHTPTLMPVSWSNMMEQAVQFPAASEPGKRYITNMSMPMPPGMGSGGYFRVRLADE